MLYKGLPQRLPAVFVCNLVPYLALVITLKYSSNTYPDNVASKNNGTKVMKNGKLNYIGVTCIINVNKGIVRNFFKETIGMTCIILVKVDKEI